MRFLQDYRRHLLECSRQSFESAMSDSWSADTVQRQALLQTEFASKAQALDEIVSLEFQAIEEFYNSERQK